MKLTTHLELQSQTTRLDEHTSYAESFGPYTGLSPFIAPHSKELIPRSQLIVRLEDTTRCPAWEIDFQIELIPLHSPLLRESLLVSFPPLINMLKFRGLSRFISDQRFRSQNK